MAAIRKRAIEVSKSIKKRWVLDLWKKTSWKMARTKPRVAVFEDKRPLLAVFSRSSPFGYEGATDNFSSI